MKGVLVGGPNKSLEDPYAKAVLEGQPAGMCYVDNSQSYSTNEVAIYWNSPLIYLLAGK
jgi:endoglucanase